MKPLNLDNSPCSPISSNCVVWQGPDIPCIKLCTGDTVSDVVAAMGKELCTILDSLKVTNYDLTCFNSTACGPEDFNALIQFLITRICELEGIDNRSTEDRSSGCPDCIVSVADCFVTGTQTTMQLTDYVQLIGQRVCAIITDISLINSQITDILIRLTTLENTSTPTFTLPTFTLNCQVGTLLSGSTQPIDAVLEQFINNVWCSFHAITGTTSQLSTGVGRNCILDATITLTQPGVGFGVAYNGTWVPDATYATVADAINNIWIALCDIQTYLLAGVTISVADTNTIDLNITGANVLTAKVQDTGWVDLLGFAWYDGNARNPGYIPQCRRIGNVIHFRGVAMVPLSSTGTTSGAIIDLVDTTGYDGSTAILPSEAAGGGVDLDVPGGAFTWNNGASVIPTSVLAATETLDGSYSLPYPSVMIRGVRLTTSPVRSTRLTSAGGGGILDSGKLYFSALKDLELIIGAFPTTANPTVGSSPLRLITSNTISGKYVPNYINPVAGVGTGTNLQNLAAANVNALTADSGFPDAAGLDVTWPFTCDAGEVDNLGAFSLNLNGLTAFVACNAGIASGTCYQTPAP